MRQLRVPSALAMLLAGAVFVLPLRCMTLLGSSPGQESPLKRLAMRSANRLRAQGLAAPRLAQQESGWDGGRPRRRPAVGSSPSVAPDFLPPRPCLAAAVGTPHAAFPLCC